MIKNSSLFDKVSVRLVLQIVGILFLVLLAIIMVVHGNSNSSQSVPATPAKAVVKINVARTPIFLSPRFS